ncbi:hypothetical protein Syun_019108 [Stephania yunnanensis]|uniref:Uncharacterized protein n=1 Tax=Stephania yunnanensis TaxID=152371 RepID=A0AAP0ITI3_9MAGN
MPKQEAAPVSKAAEWTPQHGFEGAGRGGRAVADQETSSEKAEKTPAVADLKKPSPAVTDLKKPSPAVVEKKNQKYTREISFFSLSILSVSHSTL